MKKILFDLDGTLLPMDQDEFTTVYFTALSRRFTSAGYDGSGLIPMIWKGVRAMVLNRGPQTNEDAFWQEFAIAYPDLDQREVQELFLDFYDHEFNNCITATKPTEYADKVIKAVKKKGFEIILATNPIFPQIATYNRIKWAGMDKDDFLHITTYENTISGKPNLLYYERLLRQFAIDPKDTMMIGNDAEEDLCVRQLGIKTYLVTDCLENKKNLPLITDHQGSLAELLDFINSLDSAE